MFCNEAGLSLILLVTPHLVFSLIILHYPGLLGSPTVHYAISLPYMAHPNSDKKQHAQGRLAVLSGQQYGYYYLHLVYILTCIYHFPLPSMLFSHDLCLFYF
ncbi:hypothetical protein BO82DRAFT_220538 [Aspergillus uvarum CBS 121591]|uniref:Uncharacterized protein n=1 Tax=Aspergillus uvarum CBS 121591 TaxID=1448315 RepID=A0A319BR32_9EURO|nr:hypothetical protein BO82DRAFT_220538 [Aspergillus uvarum CBS 121591]PYH75986.1 hypothetical protein BO82DRAFT_220538 [Aspergillus uvarum CBS 121591]